MKIKTVLALVLVSTTLAGNAVMAKPINDKFTPQETLKIENPTKNADADMKAVLEAHAMQNGKPIEDLTPEMARRQPTISDAAKIVMRQKGMNSEDDMGIVTSEISVQGESGMIPARIYIPKALQNQSQLPVIVYYHGGGFVLATNDVYDATPRAMANKVNAIVIAVEYRKAPEYPFPSAHNDAFAAYKWVVENCTQFGGDPRKVAVMGESAGGNLAINTSIMARDSHFQLPVYQVLIYPVAGVSMFTKSYKYYENAKPLNKAMMKWFFKQEVRNSDDKNDPRLNIVGEGKLENLPPTTLITAQIDPLRSEDQELADELEDKGNKVHYKNFNGVTHEFFGMGMIVKKAMEAEDLVAVDLRTAFVK